MDEFITSTFWQIVDYLFVLSFIIELSGSQGKLIYK